MFAPKDFAAEARGKQWVQVLARLNEGVSARQATTALETVSGASRRYFQTPRMTRRRWSFPCRSALLGISRPTLMALLGAATLVMLIACANVANLLLTRNQGRAREMSVRAALGAGRSQLIRQLLIESLILGAMGTVAGASLAFLSVRALVILGPSSIPRLSEVAVDAHVLAFAAGAAIVTSLVFGLTPAIAASGRSSGDGLALSRGVVGASNASPRRLLVISELALAVMLLAGSGLLIRSYVQLQRVAPGFDPGGVVTFSLSLPAAKYQAGAT